MAQIPQIPVVNAGMLYINGMNISNNATTPNTLLDVAAGSCRNSTNVNDIVISSTVTINTAAVGVNGLDTGTLAASTLYAVYAIGSSANQIGSGQPYSAFPGAAILSASFTAPVLPQGYDMYRRIGAIRINGSSNIVKFYQSGAGSARHMYYDVALATAITAGASATYVNVDLTGLMPNIATDANFLTVFTPTAGGNTVNLSVSGVGAVGQAVMSGSVAAVAKTGVLSCPVLATGVYYKVTGSATAISVAGYVDQL